VIDAPPQPGTPLVEAATATVPTGAPPIPREEMTDWLLARLVPGGSAAHSVLRTDVNRHTGPDQEVTVVAERYVVAGKRSLDETDSDPASQAQAAQLLTDPDGQQVVTVAELAP
jgi:hypothetical protein